MPCGIKLYRLGVIAIREVSIARFISAGPGQQGPQSPVYLSTAPPYRWTTAEQRSNNAVMISRKRSAPTVAAKREETQKPPKLIVSGGL
jgi:hypothetical protein